MSGSSAPSNQRAAAKPASMTAVPATTADTTPTAFDTPGLSSNRSTLSRTGSSLGTLPARLKARRGPSDL